MFLAALKKVLTAVGYDVENSNRIKLGLKSLVSKGILVQTSDTGASGTFKLSKKVAAELTKGKVKKPASTKTRKRVLVRDSKSPQQAKTNKSSKMSRTIAEKAGMSGRKAKGAKGKQQRESLAKARAGKPKAGNNSKLPQQQTNPRKANTKA